MTRWLIVDPTGREVRVEGDLTESLAQHPLLGCIITGCPDAFRGWRATNLDTGKLYIPEEIHEATGAALEASRARRASARTAAVQEDVRELVRVLNENVGPTIVQTIAGVTDRTLPGRWAEPDGPTPDVGAERRLRLGHQVWALINRTQGASVALSWLVGTNPLLGENVPLQYVVDERAGEVLGAAAAFVEQRG